MKRKLLFCLIVLIIGCYGFSLGKKSDIKNVNGDHVVKNNNMISMMLETETDSNIYEMVTQSSWPTEGYVFNSLLSGCENDGKLYWSDTEQKIIMESNVSDKCYVYFDKEENKVLLVDYVKSLYTGTQGENGIYYHDSNLTNGANDNSYRFAGASSQVNNFVCFGTEESPCPNDNLYRIIGVFEDVNHGVSGEQLVKLIKYDYANSNLLGTDGAYCQDISPSSLGSTYKGSWGTVTRYYWNNTYGDGLWSESKFNTVNLNNNFINGINNEWLSKIENVLWRVGGDTNDNIYSVIPSVTYKNEIVNSASSSKTYSAKIGLMYVSDHAFAAAPSYWNQYLSMDYMGSGDVDWMHMGLEEWTITHSTSGSQSIFIIYAGSTVGKDTAANPRPVRPTFFLTSSTNYVSGTGTQSDPIIIE